MDFICELVASITNFFDTIMVKDMDFAPALFSILNSNLTIAAVAALFTIFFSLRRVGYKIGAIYIWQVNRHVAQGISSVTLINYKDRPIPIFTIHAIIDGKSLELKKFDPPAILKPLEAARFEIEPASFYYDNQGRVDLKMPKGMADIYIATTNKNVKCLAKGYRSHHEIINKNRYKLLAKLHTNMMVGS